MIRIAIVEDDRHDREALKKCLNRYEKENQMKFSVTEFQDGEDIEPIIQPAMMIWLVNVIPMMNA